MNGAKVFVKIGDYKEIIDIIGLIREKIDESRSILGDLDNLKNQEDSELDLWNNALDNIKSRVDFIDNALSQEKL